MLLCDATSKFGSGDQFTLDLIKRAAKPAFLLLNKIDLLRDKAKLLPLIDHYRREYDFAEVIPISARTGDGQEVLVETLISYLPEAEALFDEETFTDQVERTIAAEMVREKKLEGISNIWDESNRHGMRVVIELKRDAMADVVLNQLYRFTPLQSTFGVNSVALNGGRPEVMTLKDMISAFIAFREEVVTRRTKFLLMKARERAHVK